MLQFRHGSEGVGAVNVAAGAWFMYGSDEENELSGLVGEHMAAILFNVARIPENRNRLLFPFDHLAEEGGDRNDSRRVFE